MSTIIMASATKLTDDGLIAQARAVVKRSLRVPRAVAARYVPQRDRVKIHQASGWSVQVPRSFSARLDAAPLQDREHIGIVGSGLRLHLPALDEDLSVPAVIETIAVAHGT